MRNTRVYLTRELYARSKRERSGKTTRTLDRLVQELFDNGICYCYENRDDSDEEKGSLMRKLATRINVEHEDVVFQVDKETKFGMTYFKVQLLPLHG